MAGAEEKGIVLGLKAGIDFGDRISSEQRQNFLHAALQDLATEGHHWTTEDRKTPANTWYTSENVWNITKALRPTVTKMLDHLHSGCGARERQKHRPHFAHPAMLGKKR